MHDQSHVAERHHRDHDDPSTPTAEPNAPRPAATSPAGVSISTVVAVVPAIIPSPQCQAGDHQAHRGIDEGQEGAAVAYGKEAAVRRVERFPDGSHDDEHDSGRDPHQNQRPPCRRDTGTGPEQHAGDGEQAERHEPDEMRSVKSSEPSGHELGEPSRPEHALEARQHVVAELIDCMGQPRQIEYDGERVCGEPPP